MYIWMYLAMLLPLVVFVIMDYKFSQKQALVAAMTLTCGMLAVLYGIFGELDVIELIGAGLLIILGVISIKTENKLYFKLQPALADMVMAIGVLVLAYLFSDHWQDYLLRIGSLAEKMDERLVAEEYVHLGQGLVWPMAIACTLHAALTYYVARHKSNEVWLAIKAAQMPLIVLVAFALFMLMGPIRTSSMG